MITIADTADSIDRFVTYLIESIERHRSTPRTPHTSLSWSVRPEQVASPREAYFAAHEMVDASAAVGRVSADLIAPYPRAFRCSHPASASPLRSSTDYEGRKLRASASPTPPIPP